MVAAESIKPAGTPSSLRSQCNRDDAAGRRGPRLLLGRTGRLSALHLKSASASVDTSAVEWAADRLTRNLDRTTDASCMSKKGNGNFCSCTLHTGQMGMCMSVMRTKVSIAGWINHGIQVQIEQQAHIGQH